MVSEKAVPNNLDLYNRAFDSASLKLCQLGPDVFDPATWGAWLTLDDQNGLNWAFVDQNVLNDYTFHPTYFIHIPVTGRTCGRTTYILFKGYQLTVNAGLLVSSPFTAANVSGSGAQAPVPSQTYSVTVQHVCVANHTIHNPFNRTAC